MTDPKPPAAQLALIQLSLILGPLMFVGVIWYVHSQAGYKPSSPADGIQYALPVICILALSGIMFVRRLRAPVTDVQQFANLSLVGWAIGEFAALAGGVYYFLSNDPTWAITGIFVLLFGAMMLPAKPANR